MYDLALHALTSAAGVAIRLADEGPNPEDVKAGWGAFGIFLGMAALVAFLGFSLTKQLKRVDRARAEGVYGAEAAAEAAEEERAREEARRAASDRRPTEPPA